MIFKIFLSTMKSILLLISLALSAFAIDENHNSNDDKSQLRNPYANIRAHTIVQRLDHFDISNNETWKMRYFSNLGYCDGADRPLFIIFGGPWAIKPDCLVFGHFHDIARKQNACLFQTEHRFYGESLPTSDLSVSNLKYLSVQQALADVENFIKFLKTQKQFANSKIILHGISYGGSMAAWFGNRNPSLVDGTWISSAPLLARLEFTDYGEMIGEIIRQFGSVDCYNRIRMGILELENLLSSNETIKVRRLLHISEEFDGNNQLDIWFLFEEISLIFSNLLQGQDKNDVSNMCDLIMASDSDISAVVNFVLRRLGNPKVLEFSYQKMIGQMSDVNDFSGLRQWYYQTCNQLGWYPTTSSSGNQPFGTKIPLDLYIRVCSDLFGSKYSFSHIQRKVNETNFYLNGEQICNRRNGKIFITYGAMDPWSSLGCRSDDNERIHCISNVSHSRDFESMRDSDSVDMRNAKQKVEHLISEWL